MKQDQAQIDNARTQLGYTTITSPLDGRTGMRQVDAGNIVHASDATGMVVITQLQPISVVFTLPQQALPQVAKAMSQGAAKVLAYVQGAIGNRTGMLDTGTLTVLDNQVDPTTGTIKLKATFPNPENRLWPGAFVGVEVQVDTAKDAVVVPPAAVQRGPRGAYVYVANADGSTARRDVKVGHEDAQAVDHRGGGEGRGQSGDRWRVAAQRRQQGDDRAAGGGGQCAGGGAASGARNAPAAGRGAGVIMRRLPPTPSRKGRGRREPAPPPLAGGGWGEGAHDIR